jgi:hypothetical protein
LQSLQILIRGAITYFLLGLIVIVCSLLLIFLQD